MRSLGRSDDEILDESDGVDEFLMIEGSGSNEETLSLRPST